MARLSRGTLGSWRPLLLACAFTIIGPVFGQSSPAELVDVAGRQRMLSQRIIKAYAQAAQYVHYQASFDQLQESIARFESQLRLLERHAPSDHVRASLAQVETLWQPFAAIARAPLQREGAAALMHGSEPLLQACQNVVTQLEQAYNVVHTKRVNQAGRQRMLSQRITKAYMLLAWGFRDEALEKELAQASIEFEAAQAELRNARENTAAINATLDEVGRQWAIFRKAFQMREKSGEYAPFFIAVAGDRILTHMEEVTAMYAGLAPAGGAAVTPPSASP